MADRKPKQQQEPRVTGGVFEGGAPLPDGGYRLSILNLNGMTPLVDLETGEAVEVPSGEAQSMLQTYRYRPQTRAEWKAVNDPKEISTRYDDPLEAAGRGVVRGLIPGADMIGELVSPGSAYTSRMYEEAWPKLSTAGEIAGTIGGFVSPVGPLAAAAKVGKAAGGLAQGAGAAARMSRGAIAGAIEGAAVGAGQGISDAAEGPEGSLIGGENPGIEHIAKSVGMGAALGGALSAGFSGTGALGSWLFGKASRLPLAKAAALRAEKDQLLKQIDAMEGLSSEVKKATGARAEQAAAEATEREAMAASAAQEEAMATRQALDDAVADPHELIGGATPEEFAALDPAKQQQLADIVNQNIGRPLGTPVEPMTIEELIAQKGIDKLLPEPEVLSQTGVGYAARAARQADPAMADTIPGGPPRFTPPPRAATREAPAWGDPLRERAMQVEKLKAKVASIDTQLGDISTQAANNVAKTIVNRMVDTASAAGTAAAFGHGGGMIAPLLLRRFMPNLYKPMIDRLTGGLVGKIAKSPALSRAIDESIDAGRMVVPFERAAAKTAAFGKLPAYKAMSVDDFRSIDRELSEVEPGIMASQIRVLVPPHVDRGAVEEIVKSGTAAISYLQAVKPKPPPGGDDLYDKPWSPTDEQLKRYSRKARAAIVPATVIEDFNKGELTPDAMEALEATQPEKLAEIRAMAEAVVRLSVAHGKKYSQKSKEQINMLLGRKEESPKLLAHLQQNFEDEKQKAEQQKQRARPTASRGLSQGYSTPMEAIQNRRAQV